VPLQRGEPIEDEELLGLDIRENTQLLEIQDDCPQESGLIRS
jgi:hypothetical protein